MTRPHPATLAAHLIVGVCLAVMATGVGLAVVLAVMGR